MSEFSAAKRAGFECLRIIEIELGAEGELFTEQELYRFSTMIAKTVLKRVEGDFPNRPIDVERG